MAILLIPTMVVPVAAATPGEWSVANDPTILEGDSGTSTVTFTIHYEADPSANGNVHVHYQTNDGTATGAGSCTGGGDRDYVSTGNIQTANAAGNASHDFTVSVTICGDTTAEAGQTFTLDLSNPSGGSDLDPDRDSGTATILNDDGLATTTILGAGPNPSTFGQSVTFTATVARNSGSGTPGGTVEFYDGSIMLGTGTLSGAGVATLSTTALAIGAHSIRAVYVGSTSYNASTSALVNQVVGLGTTTTTIGSGTNPSVVGNGVTFTAHVTPTAATGTVSFLDGATVIGTGTLAAGTATFNTSLLTVGTHHITARYEGDTTYAGSTSENLDQVVNPLPVTLTSNTNPSILNSSVTFTATVFPANQTGNVTFRDGATTIGTVALSGGSASLTTSTLTLGNHTITATFGGNSATVTQLVTVRVTFYSVLCPTYSDVWRNEGYSDGGTGHPDDTGGHTGELAAGYDSTDTAPTAAQLHGKNGICTLDPNWTFNLYTNYNSTTRAGTSVGPGSVTTGSAGSYALTLDATLLGYARAGNGTNALWVTETTQPYYAGFGSLRCYTNVLYSDDQETIYSANTPDVACIAYNVQSLTLTKTPAPTTYSAAGQTISYTYVMKNTGMPTSGSLGIPYAVADDKATVTCPNTPATLAYNATVTCHATYTIQPGDVTNGSVTNHATGTAMWGTHLVTSNQATATVTANVPVPAWTIDKTSNSGSYSLGQTITYNYLVSNTGNVAINSIAVSDDRLGAITCPKSTLAPAENMTCTATHVVDAADLNAGSITNTGTVTGTPAGGSLAPAQDSLTVTITGQAPSWTIDKSSNQQYYAPGETVHYTYFVHNTGNVTINGIVVTDDKLGTITCPKATLVADESMTCTADHAVATADIDAGQIMNHVTAVGTPTKGSLANATDDQTVYVYGQIPGITVTKQSDKLSYTLGETVHYSYTVTNPGNMTDTIGLNDDQLGAITCPLTVLPPGQSETCYADHVVSQIDFENGGIYNTVTATADTTIGSVYDWASHQVTITGQVASIALDKTSDKGTYYPGETVHYKYHVTNTGNVTITMLDVYDYNLGDISCPTTTLSVGQAIDCYADHAITSDDINAGSILNNAVASGAAFGGLNSSWDWVNVWVGGQNPAWSVEKTADKTTYAPGELITYTYDIHNTGNVDISQVSVVDDKLGTISCPSTVIPVGGDMTCTGLHYPSQAEIDAGSITNLVTIDGYSVWGTVPTEQDAEKVTITQTADLTFDKSADKTSYTLGETITYSYRVVNTGTVTINNLAIVDDQLGALTCPFTSVAPGADLTCYAYHTVTSGDLVAGSIHNTAKVSGTTALGPVSKQDDQTVTITGQHAAFSIDKVSNQPTYGPGSTIFYTYEVDNTGNVPISNVVVTDDKLGVVGCTDTTLPVGGQIFCYANHNVSLDDLNAGAVSNSATATGTSVFGDPTPVTDNLTVQITGQAASWTITKGSDKDSYGPGETIAYTYLVHNTGNVTITGIVVSDDSVGVTCPQTTLAPDESMTCTATHLVGTADLDAGSITNHATATGTATGGLRNAIAQRTVTITGQEPSWTITKTSASDSYSLGQTITYDYTAHNTGNVTINTIVVEDDPLGPITCPKATLAPDESMTCHATHVVDNTDLSAGSITNLVSASGTPTQGALADATARRTVTITGGTPSIAITKTADKASYLVGETISYTITLTNTGNVTVTNANVTDAAVTDLSCDVTMPATLAPGAAIHCTASHVTAVADGDHFSNTAAAAASYLTTALTDSATRNVTITAPAPSIAITKTADKASYLVGETISYTITLTNNGNVTVTNANVTDAAVTDLSCDVAMPATLAPGAAIHCTASHVTVAADGDHFSNTAAATANYGTTALTDSATRNVTISATPAPSIAIAKTANKASYIVGETIHYTITLTNNGNVTVTNANVTDAAVTDLSCDVAMPATLNPGAAIHCTASHVTVTDDGDHFSNTAAASASYDTTALTDSATRNVTITSAPPASQITLVKSTTTESWSKVGDVIPYHFVVTNTGDTDLAGPITIDDSKIGHIVCSTAALPAHTSVSCNANYTTVQADLNHTVNNTAIAHVGNDPVVDSAQVSVDVPFEDVGGVTSPPTGTIPGPDAPGGLPLFALLICLAFSALGLVGVQAQRRTIRH